MSESSQGLLATTSKKKFDRHVNFSDRMNLHHLEFRVVKSVCVFFFEIVSNGYHFTLELGLELVAGRSFIKNLRQLCCFCRCFYLRIWRSLQLDYDNPKVRELPRLAAKLFLFFPLPSFSDSSGGHYK